MVTVIVALVVDGIPAEHDTGILGEGRHRFFHPQYVAPFCQSSCSLDSSSPSMRWPKPYWKLGIIALLLGKKKHCKRQ